jgi:hypothetical protein
MWKREKCSVPVHGMPSGWIRRDQITGHAKPMDQFINKGDDALKAVKVLKASYLSSIWYKMIFLT